MAGNAPSRPIITQQFVTREFSEAISHFLQQISTTGDFAQHVSLDCTDYNRLRDTIIRACRERILFAHKADKLLRSEEEVEEEEVEEDTDLNQTIQDECYRMWNTTLRCELNQISLNQAVNVNLGGNQIANVQNELKRFLEANIEASVLRTTGLFNAPTTVTNNINALIELSAQMFYDNWQYYAQDASAVQRIDARGGSISFIAADQMIDLLEKTFQDNDNWVRLSQTVALEIDQAIRVQNRVMNLVIYITVTILGIALIIVIVVVLVKVFAKKDDIVVQEVSSSTGPAQINVNVRKAPALAASA